MLSVHYDPAHDSEDFAPRIEAVAPHKHVDEPYYRLRMGEVCIILSDEQAHASSEKGTKN